MFRTIAIISVRQKHHKTIVNVPFSFSRHNELINDDLSTVGKVTELCLPKAKSVWVSLRVS